VAPASMGNETYAPITPAPGTYVFEKWQRPRGVFVFTKEGAKLSCLAPSFLLGQPWRGGKPARD